VSFEGGKELNGIKHILASDAIAIETRWHLSKGS
jgi:hypothetical protein